MGVAISSPLLPPSEDVESYMPLGEARKEETSHLQEPGTLGSKNVALGPELSMPLERHGQKEAGSKPSYPLPKSKAH